MFGRKKEKLIAYDRQKEIPVIRTSICTGEQTIGFKEKATEKFREVMLVREEDDLQLFMHQYGISREEIKKEW